MKWQFFELARPQNGNARFLLTAPRILKDLPDAIYSVVEVDISLPTRLLELEARRSISRLRDCVPAMMDASEEERLTALVVAFINEPKRRAQAGGGE